MTPSPETPAAPEAPDLGLQLIRSIHDALEIPGEWSLQAHRNFTWWPHHLAQHVWAEPPRMSNDIEVVRIHASTDLLRKVPDADATVERLSALNRFATLSALVWERESAEIMLHTAAYAHARNVSWLLPLLDAAVVLQAAEAHAQVEELAGHFAAEPAEIVAPVERAPARPRRRAGRPGQRLRPGGQRPLPFTQADFDATIQMDPRPWTEAHQDGLGFSAELTLPGPGGTDAARGARDAPGLPRSRSIPGWGRA
jgi:hypothetical protein